MAFTVVPLHNLTLDVGTSAEFGAGFVLQDVPQWLRDEPILKDLNRHDREGALAATHALVAEYDAQAIGEPDPTWTGKEPKSIQDVKAEAVILANIALWLRQPSTVCYTNVFHATSWPMPGETQKHHVVQRIERQNTLHCHPRDVANPVTKSHVIKAGQLHAALVTVPRNNPVWESLRASWAALTMYSADRRYPSFWIGLESLFGSDDTNEIGYKLAQRIAFFIAENDKDARDLFKMVKTCYKMRSTIIHGRWKNDPRIDDVMYDTEAIVRTALRRLMDNPQMVKTFVSKHRNEFLEDWVFSRSTDPPPYPAALT